MKKIIIGRNKIAYERLGRRGAPKLVILHGFGGTHKFFLPACKFLKKDFDILLVDFPGFGYSERFKDNDYSLDHFAKAIHDLYSFLDFKPFNLIGHSFGGMVSIVIASKYKDDVKKLILQGAPWSAKCIIMHPWIKALLLAGRSDPLVKLVSKVKGGVDRKLLKKSLKIFNPHFFKLDDKSDGVIYHCFKTMDLKAMAEIKDMLFSFDLTKEAKSIICPTLVVIGDHDESVDVQKTQLAAKLIRNSKLKIIRKGILATHLLYLDFPKEMAKITKDFFLRSIV